MEHSEIFQELIQAPRVLVIEDQSLVFQTLKIAISGLNSKIEIFHASSLEDFEKLVDFVNKDTIVLSDYSFPTTRAQTPRSNARGVYNLVKDRCKFFAIITSHQELDFQDKDLEKFRLLKNEFVERALDLRDKLRNSSKGILSQGTIKPPSKGKTKSKIIKPTWKY